MRRSKRKPRSYPVKVSESEKRMRRLLLRLFPGKQIELNYRPDWLRGCELDAYIPSEKLALEFDGRQHREFTPHYHRNVEAFSDQVSRDLWKRDVCAGRGISVVTVTYEHIPTQERLFACIENALLAHRRSNEEQKAANVAPKRGADLIAGLRTISRAQTRKPFL